jgi:hypothetical protein
LNENLLPKHIFQFDFLNDDFKGKEKGGKIPDDLMDIITDPKKQKRLLIYINPPIAEASAGIGKGGNKEGVTKTRIAVRYGNELGKSKNELFAQFLIRIYRELPHASLGMFSTLKYLNSANFVTFRTVFNADFLNGFIVPVDTFDNVEGLFPYAFLVWRFSNNPMPQEFEIEVFDRKDNFLEKKKYFTGDGKYINDWIKKYTSGDKTNIGYLCYMGNDFQNNNQVRISPFIPRSHITTLALSKDNLPVACVNFAVRLCIKSTWLNDRDQFLYPNNLWENDTKFQTDCLIFTLFHRQNKIISTGYENHWLPFYPNEVDASENFKSTFMADFLSEPQFLQDYKDSQDLFSKKPDRFLKPVRFSGAAQNVYNAGKNLWKYYHETIKTDTEGNVNASLYEINEYFKGRNGTRMNNRATDEQFNELNGILQAALNQLAEKIQPKVYEYGFLKK